MIQASRFARIVLSVATVVLCVAAVPLRRSPNVPNSPSPDLCRVAQDLQEPRLVAVCGAVRYLGHGTFQGLGLVPAATNILGALSAQAQSPAELTAPRHFFEYDAFVLSVRNDSVRSLDMVIRAAAAVDSIRRSNPNAYRFITSTMLYPTAPSMSNTSWKNRYDRIFISFDKTPRFIAAGVTLLGPSVQEKGVGLFSNQALMSIDEVTIQGNSSAVGSGRIYGKPTAEENYRAYMADGIMFTLVHEMAHRYIDHLNSTSTLANAVYNSRKTGTPPEIDVATDAEEVIANETAMALMNHDLSDEMRRAVRQENTDLTNKTGVRDRLGRWRALAGLSRGHLVIPD